MNNLVAQNGKENIAHNMKSYKKNEKIKLLEHLYIASHIIDNHGVILWANDFEIDLLGFLPDEYVGHNFSEVRVRDRVIVKLYND